MNSWAKKKKKKNLGSLVLSGSQRPKEKRGKKTEFQTSRKVGVLIFQLVARWKKKHDKTK